MSQAEYNILSDFVHSPRLFHFENVVVLVCDGLVSHCHNDTVQVLKACGHDLVIEAVVSHLVVNAKGLLQGILEHNVGAAHLSGSPFKFLLKGALVSLQTHHFVDENVVALLLLEFVHWRFCGHLFGDGAALVGFIQNCFNEGVRFEIVLIDGFLGLERIGLDLALELGQTRGLILFLRAQQHSVLL